MLWSGLNSSNCTETLSQVVLPQGHNHITSHDSKHTFKSNHIESQTSHCFSSSYAGPQGHRDGAAINSWLASNTDGRCGADTAWPPDWTEELQSKQPHWGEVTWCLVQRLWGHRNRLANTLHSRNGKKEFQIQNKLYLFLSAAEQSYFTSPS